MIHTMNRIVAAICLFSVGCLHISSVQAQSVSDDPLTFSQWVRATADGSLQGRVIIPKPDGQVEALADVRVSLISQQGDIRSSRTDTEGRFLMQGIQPGVYSLTARGKNLVACCAMHVIEASDPSDFPANGEISVAALDPTIINTAVIRYLPPTKQQFTHSISNIDLDGIAGRVKGNELFRVARTKTGLMGTLHTAGSQMKASKLTNVFVFQNGIEVSRAVTGDDGQFAIASLAPGVYSVLAIGSQGLAVAGIELVDPEQSDAAVTTTIDGERLVRNAEGRVIAEQFVMQVAPIPTDFIADVLVADDDDEDEENGDDEEGEDDEEDKDDDEIYFFPDNGTGFAVGGTAGYRGSYAPGSGGGGGGIGGAGGGGGLGGVAATAVVAGAVAAGDNDNNNFFPVASPSLPAIQAP